MPAFQTIRRWPVGVFKPVTAETIANLFFHCFEYRGRVLLNVCKPQDLSIV
jgi:hypothetical protein